MQHTTLIMVSFTVFFHYALKHISWGPVMMPCNPVIKVLQNSNPWSSKNQSQGAFEHQATSALWLTTMYNSYIFTTVYTFISPTVKSYPLCFSPFFVLSVFPLLVYFQTGQGCYPVHSHSLHICNSSLVNHLHLPPAWKKKQSILPSFPICCIILFNSCIRNRFPVFS